MPPMLAIQLKKGPEYQLMVFCGWADGPTNTPVLMEFPHVCEIKVNGKLLEANLRGMKNKPGTVSPANITRLCRLETGDSNKVEFIYANSTKRYYASTHVVKKFSVESIVAEIERGKFLSKEKMLRMSKYFKDILNSTPKNLESITVQADGSWEIPKSSAQADAAPTPKKKTAVPAGESVFIIDEDDSDDENSAAASAPSSPPKPAKPAIEIIDLISDSEDEEDEEPARAPVDQDGDTTMQDAAASLQNMAQSNSGAPPSVKTEVFDKPTPTEQPSTAAPLPQHHSQQQPMPRSQIPPAVEIHSITGSASGSPVSACSDHSPTLSARMVINEPAQTGPPAPKTRIQSNWDTTSEEGFINALMNPRRKRQFDGKPGSPEA
ncbi:SUMO ligase siz1 [Dissophora ornata]|nr:SUMO ligase siz1 [Dissophora ornata]